MSNVHLLCYVRRDGLASWKLDSLERGTRNQPVLAYGSNAPTFARFAKKGNVLWVIGAYPDGPPSLEARIEISGELHENKEWDCEVRGSHGGSGFFGLNDSSGAVMKLVFESNDSRWSLQERYSSTEWKNIHGRALQSPRRLAPKGAFDDGLRSPGAKPLEDLADRLMERSVFISWKHADNDRNRRRFIRALVAELVGRGFSVWRDKTALTNLGVIDHYPGGKMDETMNRLLRQGILHSKVVLALWTERYGTSSSPKGPNWTRDEWHARPDAARIALVSGELAPKPQLAEPDRVVRMSSDPDVDEAVDVARRCERAYDSTKSLLRRSRGPLRSH